MRIRWNSLAFRLAIPLGVVTILVISATVVMTESFMTRTVERVFVSSEIEHLRGLVGRQIEGRIGMVIRDGVALARYPDIRNFLLAPEASRGKIPGDIREKLAYFKSIYDLDTVYAITLKSRHYYDENGLVKILDLSDPESGWFMQTLQSPEPYTINVDSDITGELHLWIDAKVTTSAGTVGLAGGGIKVDNVMEPVAAHLERYRAQAFLIDDNGRIRADSFDTTRINKPYDVGSLPHRVVHMLRDALATHQDQVRYLDEKGQVNFLLLQEIPSLGWTAVITLPREAFTEPLEGVMSLVFNGGLVLFGLLLILGAGLFWVIIGRPLGQVAKRLAAYDYAQPFEHPGCNGSGYEIALICNAFEANAKMLRRTLADYRQSEEALRHLNATLEIRVDEKTKALQQSTRDLEAYVTKLESTNDALQKAKEKAMQAAQARSNFISTVSHELRTPLNAIINFTDQIQEDFDDILNDPDLQEEAKEFLSRIMNNSRHLLQLINDLLDFTKAEAGKMTYDMKPLSVEKVINQAYENFHSMLSGTEIDYVKEVAPELPLIYADARRLLQVLLNFLSNAVKFTKSGQIMIRAYRSADMVVVEVEDSGRGIPKDKQESVFDPFTQVDVLDSGTGLGLGLVRHMCRQMQIRVELDSQVGRGSIFRLHIPLADEMPMDK